MAAIFFLSNVYLKQGIGSVYVMVDFICKGYLELIGTRVERELHLMKKSCSLCDSNPGSFAYEANRLPLSELRGLMSIEWIKVHLVLPMLF